MNSETEDQIVERKLRHAGGQLKREDSMVTSVMSRVESASPPRRRLLHPWAVRGMALAAGIAAISAGVWFAVVIGGASPALAYADVVKALEKVRTARFVVDGADAGNRFTCTYEQGVGLRFEGAMDGVKLLVVDDGKRQWMRQGDGDVTEADSIGLMGQFTKALMANEYLDGAKRDRGGDETIDGVPCRLYAKPQSEVVPGMRVWLDGEDRVRRLEVGRVVDGKWVARQTGVVHYDVPVDRKLFEPPAVPGGGKPVDMKALVASEFSLDDAVAKAEALGMILAIHEVRRGDDGTLLVRSSLRPTAETLEKFGGGGPGPDAMGDHQFDSRDPARYSVVPVAEYMSGRLFAKWDLFVPLKPPAEGPASVNVLADVYTRDLEFMRSFTLQKQDAHVNDVELGAVPIPREAVPTDELIAGIWSRCKSLHSIFTPVNLSEATRLHPSGKRSMKTTRMDNWTAERLTSEVKLEIRQRREGDIQRQRAVHTRD